MKMATQTYQDEQFAFCKSKSSPPINLKGEQAWSMGQPSTVERLGEHLARRYRQLIASGPPSAAF